MTVHGARETGSLVSTVGRNTLPYLLLMHYRHHTSLVLWENSVGVGVGLLSSVCDSLWARMILLLTLECGFFSAFSALSRHNPHALHYFRRKVFISGTVPDYYSMQEKHDAAWTIRLGTTCHQERAFTDEPR